MKNSCAPPAGRSPEINPGATIHLMVGTAGHIDHGKTALVKCLTGCDTDRLPEEKARGMTIDLGFAACALSDGRRIGIVDVPGHERFIHNMVAGVTGIDVVLLVVAADDGVMPQTIEHFHIVRLLGVRRGMVVITKTDLVAPERIEEVKDQVRRLVAGSFLEGCALAPMSTKTGEGFDGFYEAFLRLVVGTAERDAEGPFRLHVERVFVLQGQGVIVSGIPRSGSARIGDTLQLLPGESLKRIRSIQVYGAGAETVRAGECVALKMSDLDSREAVRGSILATPGYFSASRFVDGKFVYLRDALKPLEPRTAIRLHIGTSDVPGHLVLPTLNRLEPGGESYIQIQLQAPVVAAAGDPFVIRALSPVHTLGGGYVVALDAQRLRRSRGGWVDTCAERDRAFREPRTALEYVFQQAGHTPLRFSEAAHQALVNETHAREHILELVKTGRLTALEGERYVHPDAVRELQGRILELLNRLHDQQPLSAGFPRANILQALAVDRILAEHAIAALQTSGTLAETKALLSIPGRAPKLAGADSALAESILRLYRDTAFASPRPDELPLKLNQPVARIEPLVRLLIQTGQLVMISDKVILHPQHLDMARQKLIEHLRVHAKTDAATFKEIIGTTRKYAIPLLEYWDKRGLTRRIGDSRVLAKTD